MFAVLTLPASWRGLQPLDGLILLATYLVYLAQAVLRGRGAGEDVTWEQGKVRASLAGVAVLALGAYFTVLATQGVVSSLDIPEAVGGLFITAPMAALPETFAAWSVARGGQVTSATTSVIGDYAATMTLAFLPLALVTLEIDNFRLFWVSLSFAALLPALYGLFIRTSGSEPGLMRWQIMTLGVGYLFYVAVVVFWVLGAS